MPLYEYECPLCKVKVEKIKSVEVKHIPCPECTGIMVRVPSGQARLPHNWAKQ